MKPIYTSYFVQPMQQLPVMASPCPRPFCNNSRFSIKILVAVHLVAKSHLGPKIREKLPRNPYLSSTSLCTSLPNVVSKSCYAKMKIIMNIANPNEHNEYRQSSPSPSHVLAPRHVATPVQTMSPRHTLKTRFLAPFQFPTTI